MQDFIGFTYNGKHSINDFNIYRTSNGSRYDDNLVPSMTDKTADVPGADGQYFFNTTHKNRQFSVSIAFDSLTEEKYREMRSWLDGKEIHDLIFDEAPYKVYSAKVTGTPQLKTICFDQVGQRVYKGEGTIQFTCYHPYAHTPNFKQGNFVQQTTPLKKGITVPCGIYVKAKEYVCNNFGANLKLHCVFINSNTIIDKEIAWSTKPSYVQQFSQTEDVFIDKITLSEDQRSNVMGQIRVGTIKMTKDDYGKEKPAISENGNIIVDNMIGYIYSDHSNYFYPGLLYSWSKDEEKTNTSVIKTINFYDIGFYPHSFSSSKLDWMFTSGLLNHTDNGDNYGDIPAPFIVMCSSIGNNANNKTTWKVGDLEVTIDGQWIDVQWDSKTGLITGKAAESDETVILPYTGKSYGALQVGKNDISIGDATLKYNYWYY